MIEKGVRPSILDTKKAPKLEPKSEKKNYQKSMKKHNFLFSGPQGLPLASSKACPFIVFMLFLKYSKPAVNRQPGFRREDL